jgi:hypothetical protein
LKLKAYAAKIWNMDLGYLRLKVEPPKAGYPEFLNLDGTYDCVLPVPRLDSLDPFFLKYPEVSVC